jgi:hypothetical protein
MEAELHVPHSSAPTAPQLQKLGSGVDFTIASFSQSINQSINPTTSFLLFVGIPTIRGID